MHYEGHIENGAIVLNEPVCLKEGASVRIEYIESMASNATQMPLRGTNFRYDAPFSPASNTEDWNAAQ